MPPPPLILLATSASHPTGESSGSLLVSALAARSLRASWAIWTAPAAESIPWASAALIALRSTWDYHSQLAAFLAWTEGLPPQALLHSPEVFAWNTDKAYLLQLRDRGVAIVPTVLVGTVKELRAQLARQQGQTVVKPAVGASGAGVQLVDERPGEEWRPDAERGPWVVQPFVPSIKVEGEVGVYVIDGVARAQVRKWTAEGDFRCNRHAGAWAEAVRPMDDEAGRVAMEAWKATEEVLGIRLSYARIDLLRWEGKLVVSEVEVTEPGLCLDVVPELADHFADMVKRRLEDQGKL